MRGEIEVVESGFTYFGGDTPYVQYAAILQNPNAAGWVGDVTVSIAFYSGDGSVLERTDEYVRNALPGKFAVGGVAFDVEGVRTMEVEVDTDWVPIDFTPGSFTASRVKLTQSDFGSKVSGVLSCDFKDDPENVRVVGVLRDKAGHVVGGEAAYIDKVRCAKGSPFTVETLGRMTRAAKAEAYVG